MVVAAVGAADRSHYSSIKTSSWLVDKVVVGIVGTDLQNS